MLKGLMLLTAAVFTSVLFSCSETANKAQSVSELSVDAGTIPPEAALNPETAGTGDYTVTEADNTDFPSAESSTTENDEGRNGKNPVIKIIDGVTYIDGILIANKTYALPSDYAPGGLTAETENAFNEMRKAASAEGIALYIVSGYRSYAVQKYVYDSYVATDGKDKADTYSARPGHSEHQTGMAMDINSCTFDFAETPEGIWLAEHCYEYGFIIRYPKGMEEVTGYVYEPWHVRYLGVETARLVYESGLCLEDYLGIDSEYKN